MKFSSAAYKLSKKESIFIRKLAIDKIKNMVV
jgi:hypothetical protein